MHFQYELNESFIEHNNEYILCSYFFSHNWRRHQTDVSCSSYFVTFKISNNFEN